MGSPLGASIPSIFVGINGSRPFNQNVKPKLSCNLINFQEILSLLNTTINLQQKESRAIIISVITRLTQEQRERSSLNRYRCHAMYAFDQRDYRLT